MWDALVASAFGVAFLFFGVFSWFKWDAIVEGSQYVAQYYERTPFKFLARWSMKPGRWGSGSRARTFNLVWCIAFSVMFFAFAISTLPD